VDGDGAGVAQPGQFLSGVQVAKYLLAAEMFPGDRCTYPLFNKLNPADAVVSAIYSIPSAAPTSPVTSLAVGTSGAALTGAVQLVPGTLGSVTITESGQQIIIDASGGGGGSASAPVVRTSASAVTINNTLSHVLNTITFTLSASTTVLVPGTIHFRYGSPSAGLHMAFLLGGSQNGPRSSIGGNDELVNQTSEAQPFLCAFYQTIASRSHTLQLQVSEALAASTATICRSQVAMKA
jgi:hypothetical protein